MLRIAPTIRYAWPSRLSEEVDRLVVAGADWIHLAVADDHHASNTVLAHSLCRSLRRHCSVPIDVHLMVRPVDALIERFADAGADVISFHPDGSAHVDRTLRMIRDLGCRAGLAFAPAEPLDALEPLLDLVDLVLVTTAPRDFGEKGWGVSALRKVEHARRLIDASGRDIRLQVHAGVDLGDLRRVAHAGADTFVVSLDTPGQTDCGSVLDGMRRELAARSPLPGDCAPRLASPKHPTQSPRSEMSTQ